MPSAAQGRQDVELKLTEAELQGKGQAGHTAWLSAGIKLEQEQ